MVATAWPAWWILDRGALPRGELWRPLSCHLVHGNALHLGLNLAAALVLFHLARPTRWLVLSSFAVGGAVLYVREDLTSYCGLSGVLHAHVAESLTRRLHIPGVRWTLVGLCALLGKLCVDVGWPSTGLSSGLRLGAVPVPEAHVLGSVVGLVLGALASRPAGMAEGERPAPGSG